MQNFFRLGISLFFFLSLSCKKGAGKPTGDNPGTGIPAANLLRCNGTRIVDSAGTAVPLRGVAFGNEVWSGAAVPSTHHNELDFARVQAMHMNVVRFYLSYQSFEDDAAPYQYKQAGFDWLDKNIAWAKKYGIYLILNMHVPQGGYQSQGKGDALWTNAASQDRLVALWKAISAHCKTEKQIAGYGFVNEPVPTANMQQWSGLAQRLADAVRSQKDNHILFVEKAIYVKGAAADANLNFPAVTGENIAYELHLYDPFQFTHQLFDWANLGDGGTYPDESILSYSDASWHTATFNNPMAPAGTGNWTYYEGEKYRVTDPKIKLGLAALVGAGVQGKIYFDNIQVKEYNPDGSFSRVVVDANPQAFDGWGYWSANGSGSAGFSSATGAGDATSFYIQGATADCNISNYSQVFQPKQNFYYQANGYMKGEAVASGAGCRLRVDFLTTDKPVLPRNKAYLESVLNSFVAWSEGKNVPLYVGEFGAGVHCFENNKGGLVWVNDMLDILMRNNISFTYHAYHEDSFGLYYGYGSLPDPARTNQPLIDLFTQKLQ